MKQWHIKNHEIGLKFVKGDFREVLGPGQYWIWTAKTSIEIYSLLEPHFVHKLKEVLAKEPALQDRMLVIDLAEHQRALVWRDGRLGWFLNAGLHLFWKGPIRLEVETFEIDDEPFEHSKLENILTHPNYGILFHKFEVAAFQKGILVKGGRFLRLLDEGRYVFWKQSSPMTIQVEDLREQILDVAGQEIMTADKVTLRLNLVVTYQVQDCLKAALAALDVGQSLYRESQLALRAAVGTRTLDALLADKEAVGGEIRETLKARSAELGLSLRGVGVRDIVLPGDMKDLLNQVTEASKRAEANLIKRREETAAARSQANTAKILNENPILLRLKELETIQEVLSGAKTTFIFGSGGLQQGFRELLPKDET